jgi:ribosomal protein S18 acetylase RimI-like enzyme
MLLILCSYFNALRLAEFGKRANSTRSGPSEGLPGGAGVERIGVSTEIDIRRVTPGETSLLAEMRVRSVVERRPSHASDVDEFLRRSEVAFAAALADGRLRAWLAFDGARPVGTASLMFLPSLPRLGRDVVCDGRIRNVYVDPDYRRRGIALALMRIVLAEAVSANVDRLTLGTSDQGRALYEKLGFIQKDDELIFEG